MTEKTLKFIALSKMSQLNKHIQIYQLLKHHTQP